MRLRFEHGRRDELQTLHPAYFAMVMATGIVSIAAHNPNFAPHSLIAWSNKALNIGSSSPRAPEITRSTSDAAVCCSSASASCFFRSALAARRRSTPALAFVRVERGLRAGVRLFAPLRAKVTSSTC
jgi:hypothetical protein